MSFRDSNPLDWVSTGSYLRDAEGEDILYDLSADLSGDFMAWVLEAIQGQYKRDWGLLD